MKLRSPLSLAHSARKSVSRETLSLSRLSRAWWYFVGEPDTHLERCVALVTLPRVLLLLPFVQSHFSPTVGQFTNLVPQWAWALLSLWIVTLISHATARPFLLKARVQAMRWAGAHWLVLAGLIIMGDPTALSGWYYLIVCLAPLAAICRLSPPKVSPSCDLPPSPSD